LPHNRGDNAPGACPKRKPAAHRMRGGRRFAGNDMRQVKRIRS
jgi:hypothetical protein